MVGRKSIRGQSVVELAILMPVLMLLTLGALDFGRAYYFYAGVTNAARVGAQFAMLKDPAQASTTQGRAEIKESVIVEASPYVAIPVDRVSLIVPEAWISGKDITVRVRFDYHFISPMAARIWGDPIVITCQSTARFE